MVVLLLFLIVGLIKFPVLLPKISPLIMGRLVKRLSILLLIMIGVGPPILLMVLLILCGVPWHGVPFRGRLIEVCLLPVTRFPCSRGKFLMVIGLVIVVLLRLLEFILMVNLLILVTWFLVFKSPPVLAFVVFWRRSSFPFVKPGRRGWWFTIRRLRWWGGRRVWQKSFLKPGIPWVRGRPRKWWVVAGRFRTV